ncbi:MAG: hypothetical protein C0467_03055 [Planctomycetaceae bacterium]|nr:hypothetical protein [Planctomycetaceae bacterium]
MTFWPPDRPCSSHSRSKLKMAKSIDDLTLAELTALRSKVAEYEKFVPPGHFYSPVPDQEEFARREPLLYAPNQSFPGIDLRDESQLKFLTSVSHLQRDLPFHGSPQPEHRYYFDNDFYSYGDAIIYSAVLRHFRPQRVIEVGSGFSSALLLDVNLLFANGQIDCTFVEPFPTRLLQLLRPVDHSRVRIHQSMLQDIDLAIFSTLREGDVLFVDSTHVAKAGSDVNLLFFQILPQLAKGVLVHIHDVFDPFEYPAAWVRQGRSWNELYLLRAFLQFNSAFEVIYFNDYMAKRHGEAVAKYLPLAMKNPGGSLWLKKAI